MFNIIPNLFASYPVTSPPSTEPSPSLGEKVSARGESDPFERALDKAMKKSNKPERSSDDEEPEATYGVASVTTPVENQVKTTEASSSESDGSVEAVASTNQTAGSETTAATDSTTDAAAPATTTESTPTTASDSTAAQAAAAAVEALAAQIATAETSTTPADLAQAAATTGATVPDETILPEVQTTDASAAQDVAAATTTTQTPVDAEPVTTTPVPTEIPTQPAETATDVEPTAQTSDDATSVQVTIRQAGTGMKQGYSLEGEMQSETGTESGADTESFAPKGVAAGWGTDGTPGKSNVQFSESARLAEARSTEVVQQISDQIEALSKASKATVHLQLQPEELGRIDLRLTSTANGIRVSMTTDQPLTREILESNLGNLRDALAGAGISLNSLNINQDNQTGQGYFARESANNYGQTMKASIAADEPEATTVAMKTSMIDYRV